MTATDDNTLGDISTDTLLTTLNISGSDQANITVGSEATKLATVNTSGMSDDLTLTLQAAVNQVVTGGAANETVALVTTLNSDTVDLGAGTDVVSATVTSSTATTGALSISNVETINLTNAGTSVIDASGISGASEMLFLPTQPPPPLLVLLLEPPLVLVSMTLMVLLPDFSTSPLLILQALPMP